MKYTELSLHLYQFWNAMDRAVAEHIRKKSLSWVIYQQIKKPVFFNTTTQLAKSLHPSPVRSTGTYSLVFNICIMFAFTQVHPTLSMLTYLAVCRSEPPTWVGTAPRCKNSCGETWRWHLRRRGRASRSGASAGAQSCLWPWTPSVAVASIGAGKIVDAVARRCMDDLAPFVATESHS